MFNNELVTDERYNQLNIYSATERSFPSFVQTITWWYRDIASAPWGDGIPCVDTLLDGENGYSRMLFDMLYEYVADEYGVEDDEHFLWAKDTVGLNYSEHLKNMEDDIMKIINLHHMFVEKNKELVTDEDLSEARINFDSVMFNCPLQEVW